MEQTGQYTELVRLITQQKLMDMLPDQVVRYFPDLFESFYGKKIHVMVRFGMWNEILEEPFPEDKELYAYTTAAMHQARATALAETSKAIAIMPQPRSPPTACG